MTVANAPRLDDRSGQRSGQPEETSAGSTSRTDLPTIANVIVEVAPFHLDRPFDYRIPAQMVVDIGHRVEVVFAGRRVRGLVVGLHTSSAVADQRLRDIRRNFGDFSWATSADIDLFAWAAQRFGAPRADVIRHALPTRVVDVERRAVAAGWLTPAAMTGKPATQPVSAGPVAPRHEHEADEAHFAAYDAAGGDLVDAVRGGAGSYFWRPLAHEVIAERIVELASIAVSADRGVLVIVPDPASAVAEAIMARFGDAAVDLRSGLGDRARYQRWLKVRAGQCRVVVGERGAAFAPVARLGLAIVVDEANPALKERRSPRHHAREVILERARRSGGVGLATGMVPSAVAWRLLRQRRLIPVSAPRALERQHRPVISVVDFSREPRARLSRQSLQVLRRAVDEQAYGVVLASRGGIGAGLVCRDCDHRTACRMCGAMLAARNDHTLQCGRCGNAGIAARCDNCRSRQLVPLAAGTRQLAHEISRSLGAPVQVMEGYDAAVPAPPAILVMTRGSVLDQPPGPVEAVVIADWDALLRRPSLDAAEDALRLVMAVSRWPAMSSRGDRKPSAGPARTAGRQPEVVIQTSTPDHYAVRALERWDPGSFWRHETHLRASLHLPPDAEAVRIEVRGDTPGIVDTVLADLADVAFVLGPMPTDDGMVIVATAPQRAAIISALQPARMRMSRDGVDVRIDVDPIDT